MIKEQKENKTKDIKKIRQCNPTPKQSQPNKTTLPPKQPPRPPAQTTQTSQTADTSSPARLSARESRALMKYLKNAASRRSTSPSPLKQRSGVDGSAGGMLAWDDGAMGGGGGYEHGGCGLTVVRC